MITIEDDVHARKETNWWKTSKIWGSKSGVKSKVSNVDEYFWTCSWCYK